MDEQNHIKSATIIKIGSLFLVVAFIAIKLISLDHNRKLKENAAKSAPKVEPIAELVASPSIAPTTEIIPSPIETPTAIPSPTVLPSVEPTKSPKPSPSPKFTPSPTPKSVWDSYTELPQYSKDGEYWKNLAVDPSVTEEQLIELAKALHAGSGGTRFRIFDDDNLTMFNKFKEADINYPDEENYPYPEAWADKHYIGIINEMMNFEKKTKEWQLVLYKKGKNITL